MTGTEKDLQSQKNAAGGMTAEEMLAKVDKESQVRKTAGYWAKLITLIAVAMSVYHLVTCEYTLPSMHHRSIHLAFLVALTFLLYPVDPARKSNRIPPLVLGWYFIALSSLIYLFYEFDPLGLNLSTTACCAAGVAAAVGAALLDKLYGRISKGNGPSVPDLIWLVLALSSSLYIFFQFDAFSIRGRAVPLDYFMGGVVILCVLEATRRSVGKELALLAVVFLAYGYYGYLIPGTFGHTGFSVKRLIYQIYLSSEGIFGTALGVSATYIFLFILFGAFLTVTGMGRFIKDIALCLSGRTIGGEAKVAIVASGMMGMINGSAVGNVAATGSFTIPMMREAGFPPVFAAAVVAVAGTGGMIMPPVMGSASFIMAEYLGLHYSKIMLAAAIPAVLYYLAEYYYIHVQAKKQHMRVIPSAQITPFLAIMKKEGHLILPIILIVWELMIGRTPLYAAFHGILCVIVVSSFRASSRMSLSGLVKALADGARQCVSVGVACAVVGVIIAITNMSGLGLVLGDNIVSLAGGSVFLTTFFTMVVSIILGMGLPTTACYIVTATIAAPPLIKMGVNPLAVHMFVYYFACLSNLTPPVAIASYGAAGISGQNPSKVGWMGFRISLAAFLIPFTFIYSPQLLLVEGTVLSISWATITSMVGACALASALQGYLLSPLNPLLRVLLFAAAVGLIFPEVISDIAGIAILAGLWLYQRNLMKKGKGVES